MNLFRNYFKKKIEVEYFPNSTHIAFYNQDMEPVKELCLPDSTLYYTLETLDWTSTYFLRALQLLFTFIIPEGSLLFRSAVSVFLVIPTSSLIRTFRCWKMEQLKWLEALIDIVGETTFKLSLSVGGYFLFAPLGLIPSFIGATGGQFFGSYLWDYLQNKVKINELAEI